MIADWGVTGKAIKENDAVEKDLKELRFRTRRAWYEMKRRCDRPDRAKTRWYFGRGITYDPRWSDFNEFLNDMGLCPENLTLDRIDSTGNYCKENCRWTSWHVQQANRTNNNETVGVNFHKATGKWRAYIRPNGKQISLGYYRDYSAAVAARKEAELQLNWW